MAKSTPEQIITISKILDILYSNNSYTSKKCPGQDEFLEMIYPEQLRNHKDAALNINHIWTNPSRRSQLINRSADFSGKFARITITILNNDTQLIYDIHKNWHTLWQQLNGNLKDLKDEISVCRDGIIHFIDEKIIGEVLAGLLLRSNNPGQVLTILSLFALLGSKVNAINFDWNSLENEIPKQTSLRFCTYYDLRSEFNLTSMDIAKQLVANDYALYGNRDNGITESVEGTPELWSEHITATPDYWGFLCQNDTRIIGNWSFTTLDSEQEQLLCSGIYEAEILPVEKAKYLFSREDNLSIDLLNFSLNDGYQSLDNYDILWKTFLAKILELVRRGSFIHNIYIILFRADHIGLFKSLGFLPVQTNTTNGKLYKLDLLQPFSTKLSYLAPELQKLYETHVKERKR